MVWVEDQEDLDYADLSADFQTQKQMNLYNQDVKTLSILIYPSLRILEGNRPAQVA